MASVARQLASSFVCAHCGQSGAHVERLAMSGTGISRLLEIQAHRCAFVSCRDCRYTEALNLKVLDRKDDLSTFLEVLFAD